MAGQHLVGPAGEPPLMLCGRQLLLAFARCSRARHAEIDAQFVRVFDGNGTADDLRALAVQYDCAARRGHRAG